MNTQALVELNSVKAFLFQNVANRKSQMLSLFCQNGEKNLSILPSVNFSADIILLFCHLF